MYTRVVSWTAAYPQNHRPEASDLHATTRKTLTTTTRHLSFVVLVLVAAVVSAGLGVVAPVAYANTATGAAATSVPATTKGPVAKGPTTTTTLPAVVLDPLLSRVQGDLYRLSAIADFQPALSLVSQARSVLDAANAKVSSALSALIAARTAQNQSAANEAAAAERLRQIALAAYVGAVGPSGGFASAVPPGVDPSQSSASGTDQSAISAIDAQEMLVIVGQQARADYVNAVGAARRSASTVADAQRSLMSARRVVGHDQSLLDSALGTLTLVEKAATTPATASSPPLPDLGGPPSPGPTITAPSPIVPHAPLPAPVRTATLSSSQTVDNPPTPRSPDILGAPVLTAGELAAWYASTGHQADTTVPIAQITGFYARWGSTLGVRDDLAFAQSIVETGYFSFPAGGQLVSTDNNFAGIGACDSCATGMSFPDANTGVEAQLELLYQFATKGPLPAGTNNVVGSTSLSGCCKTWVQLAGHWATSPVYGQSIMTVYESMLNWVIPRREASAGIPAPAPPA